MKIILHHKFDYEGEARVNHMKLKALEDGNIQVYVTNGERRGYFRMNVETQKQLKDWLNEVVK